MVFSMTFLRSFTAAFSATLLIGASCSAGLPSPRGPLARTWDAAYSRMQPWSGPSRTGSNASTLHHKLMCGYQGWFSAPGDGAGAGWIHFGTGIFKPGISKIDLWPDMTETSPDEQYPTEFHNADGSPAVVFSSYNPKTVNRHFQWMAEYGIDGVFLQRFGSDMYRPADYDFCNAVLDNVRNAANANGRTWAVMYDLSSLSAPEISSVIVQDWKRLVDRSEIRRDPAYQKHRGKPVVAIWGVGIDDGRKYTLHDCELLVDLLKGDSKYGGNSVMLGIPYGWRELSRDSVKDPYLHSLIQKADIVSPWSVTRYRTASDFKADVSIFHKPDLAWCREHHLDYLPVIFPGFSWTNLLKTRNKDGEPHRISREKGAFLWAQGAELAKIGADMLYVAMFDELDEGTAIVKCSGNPPTGKSVFRTEPGVAPDYYLWLTGRIGQLLRKELPISEYPPVRANGH